ncbi:hypothetical protein [Brevundimonas sp. GCM10030266]|uniref:hypothetical protein n=1 Tax=Brevundimonas sp. GCM10030266 TaxID=3273386 RepID=UPI00360657E7
MTTPDLQPEWPVQRDELISVETAFDALHAFVSAYVARGGHTEDALLNLQFWTSRENSQPPVDPAMWLDWLTALDQAKARIERP